MMIRAEHVWRKFGRFDALRGLDLSVPVGSAFALVGANGAGKTTTIKILMNILEPTRGTATVMGVDSVRLSPKELSRIGYVSENQKMPERLTVAEYLAYLRPFYPDWDRVLEASIVTDLGLPLDRRIRDLSHGMRMKMALACALPFRPRLLVLDEPFSGLDPLIRDQFMEGLLRQGGDLTILISSHELSEIEGVATHVGFVSRGRLKFQESMEGLSARMRQVHVTLEEGAAAPAAFPAEWVGARRVGNVLTFVDTQFSEDGLESRLRSLIGSARRIDVSSMPLRSIFTTLASGAEDEVI